MRFILVGLLNLTLAGIVCGQAVGDVESIGFGRAYRPNTWTPMVVRLTPTTGAPFRGKIQVIQEDLDKDRVLFTRTIDLRGNAESGGEKTQRYWMYFIPQPKLWESGTDLNDLNKYKLQVFLCTESGKQIVQLPIKDPIADLEHSGAHPSRSTKLVLYVTDQSKPIFSPYGTDMGLKEDVATVQIPINSVRSLLPENVLGYEAVDAMVWLDADPTLLTPEQRAAIEEWVRRGGKLVVCQTGKPNLWDVVRREFAALLPVTVSGIEQAQDLTAIKRIVADRAAKAMLKSDRDAMTPDQAPKWATLRPPFPIARAVAKPGAIVAEVFDTTRRSPDDPYADSTPWLVRGSYGSGQVTWVAQDLGDPSVAGFGVQADREEDYKWAYVWDRVFDWPNDSQAGKAAGAEQSRYRSRYPDRANDFRLTDIFTKAMDFSDKGVGYLGLAVLFFIVYWIVAGPGSYLFLASRKKAGYSWFAFSLTALIATALTVVIVKLLLRGAPELHHATFVRTMPGEPAQVYSEIGLYIPRDGEQKVELKNAIPETASYVTAFPDLDASGSGFNDHADYEVNVADPKVVSFRYRSTLKKLQAHWVGRTDAGIEGSATLGQNQMIAGSITNKTGRDLHNVMVAFHYPSEAVVSHRDWLLYLGDVKKDDLPIDLGLAFSRAKTIRGAGSVYSDTLVRDTIGIPGLSGNWDDLWYKEIKDRPSNPSDQHGFEMLCLYDRLPTWGIENSASEHTRYDLHRPALRELDASNAIGSGKMVVMASTDPGPIPIPLEVEGDKVTGTGITYYQSILPLDCSALAPKPSTRPATQPPTQPTSGPVSLGTSGEGAPENSDDEIRRTNQCSKDECSNDETKTKTLDLFRHSVIRPSGLIRHSNVVIRHSQRAPS